MDHSAPSSPSPLQRALDFIERAGNRAPHPGVLFLGLIVAVIVLSHALWLGGVSTTYQRINLQTYETETITTSVRSLLSAEGIRFIFTSVVPNFINFGPVGIILVAMIGVGLAERAGLIQAVIRKIVIVAPRGAMTAIIVTLGVVSSIASDAGYLVLIPLGASAFFSLGRHPLAGLAAAFAGVAAAFGANFLVKPIDGILAEMTTDAIHIIDPSQSLELTANFYFGLASRVVLIVVCTAVTAWIVEPRLGAYSGDAPLEEPGAMPADEGRGLMFALIALIGFVLVVGGITIPANGPLRHPETGSILGGSPFMDSLVFLIMLAFLVTGLAYGCGAKTIRNSKDAIDAITATLADLGGLLFLFFVISQFVAYFNFSNIGTVLAVTLADALKDAQLNSVTLLLAFLLIGVLMSIPVPNILPKWAILAPVFVPLFIKLGVAPDAVLAAYRVSDSPPNVINPLLPHFALVVGFAQRWQKDAGVGTVVAMMLPYAAVTLLAWTLLFFAWYQFDVPFGPG
ncbi:MAG TPA: AbgT family transporter [Lacipirellulaceae bacterium]|nr:AbgT family transporter [Lacipirellulaceae bacterium]